jgi:hypothetical protein
MNFFNRAVIAEDQTVNFLIAKVETRVTPQVISVFFRVRNLAFDDKFEYVVCVLAI